MSSGVRARGGIPGPDPVGDVPTSRVLFSVPTRPRVLKDLDLWRPAPPAGIIPLEGDSVPSPYFTALCSLRRLKIKRRAATRHNRPSPNPTNSPTTFPVFWKNELPPDAASGKSDVVDFAASAFIVDDKITVVYPLMVVIVTGVAGIVCDVELACVDVEDVVGVV